jgi:hypothetical protein
MDDVEDLYNNQKKQNVEFFTELGTALNGKTEQNDDLFITCKYSEGIITLAVKDNYSEHIFTLMLIDEGNAYSLGISEPIETLSSGVTISSESLAVFRGSTLLFSLKDGPKDLKGVVSFLMVFGQILDDTISTDVYYLTSSRDGDTKATFNRSDRVISVSVGSSTIRVTPKQMELIDNENRKAIEITGKVFSKMKEMTDEGGYDSEDDQARRVFADYYITFTSMSKLKDAINE